VECISRSSHTQHAFNLTTTKIDAKVNVRVLANEMRPIVKVKRPLCGHTRKTSNIQGSPCRLAVSTE